MNRRRSLFTIISTLALAALFGCGDDSSTGDSGVTDAAPSDGGSDATTVDSAADDAAADAATPPRTFGGDRPARLIVPSSYDASTPMPLVVLLHGYGADSRVQDAYFSLSRTARRRGFLLLLPDGTFDSMGNRYWNATPACCSFAGTDVDDVSYLTSLLDDVEAAYNVDAQHVYFIGHSNGGFMSFRMACDLGDRIAGIVSLAGGGYVDESLCMPTTGVSVLQIQGTADTTVAYGPSLIGPGAVASVERWASRDGCDATMPEVTGTMDLETTLPGEETTITTYPVGCDAGLEATLWTINGGGHIPVLQANIGDILYDWLSAHAR